MIASQAKDKHIREALVELLTGGFAPTVILLREFHPDKAGIVLDGLFYSAYSLLEHMRHRQHTLLKFMQDPAANPDVWPGAYWPENPVPASEPEWYAAISRFEQELERVISVVANPDRRLYDLQPNGKTLAWAAMTILYHNGYHIGQIKIIGRQLGVW